jgi:hypothetical protein
VRIGFQLDIDAFEKQTAAHGIKIVRKKDPEPARPDERGARLFRPPALAP